VLQPHKPQICAAQLKMLGRLLQTDRAETRDRVAKVIQYCAGVPEFYDAINHLVCVEPEVLNGSMSFLLRNPALLSFRSKEAYFRLQVEDSFTSMARGGHYGSDECQLVVARQNLVRSVVQQMLRQERDQLRSQFLHVRFVGEEGMGTGPARELFSSLPREILKAATEKPFNKASADDAATRRARSMALFTATAHGRTFHPRPGSLQRPVFPLPRGAPAEAAACKPDDDVMIIDDNGDSVPVAAAPRHPAGPIQNYLVPQPEWAAPAAAGGRGDVIMAQQGMLAVGRLVGLALRHKILFDVRFSGAFWRLLVGLGVSLDDLEEVDPDLHRSLALLLSQDGITELVETTFVVTETDGPEDSDLVDASLSLPAASPSSANSGGAAAAREGMSAAERAGMGSEEGKVEASRGKEDGHAADDDVEVVAPGAAGSRGNGGGAGGGGEGGGGGSSGGRGAQRQATATRETREVELVAGGAKKAVTEANKRDYVSKYAQYKLAKAEGLEEVCRCPPSVFCFGVGESALVRDVGECLSNAIM